MERPIFIDPTTNFGFKRIFADDNNKDLLKAFLNDLLRGKNIVDLCYNKIEHVKDTQDTGGLILDLTCTTRKGEQLLIEVQRSSHLNVKKRVLYHGSKLISDQAPKGQHQDWNYATSEVYVIVIMDGFRMPGTKNNNFLHDIYLCNRETGDVFDENLGFIFLELVNFIKSETELDNDLDGWLYVLKNMPTMKELPRYLQKPTFEKLFQIAEYSRLNKEEKDKYSLSLKRKRDEKVVYEYHQKELINAQRKAAEEARVEEKRTIVRKLIEQSGMADHTISWIAGVSLEFINQVGDQMDDASLKRMWDAQGYEEQLAEARKAGIFKSIQEEIEEEKRATVSNMIVELDIDNKTIARIADVPLEFVQEVRTNLKKKK